MSDGNLSTCPDLQLLGQDVARAIDADHLVVGGCVNAHRQSETIPDGSLERNISVKQGSAA